ncbi:MAG: transcription termination/antitermination protein NusA [Acidobacteria bacterium]|nr:transcription termination/antitermination protein NusA [Acidobacteriota bacterium]
MAHNDLIQAIEAIGREKGIEREVIIRALEEAFAAASRKVIRTRENIVSVFDEKTGEFGIFAKKKVVPEVSDDETEISLEDAIEIDPAADFDQELTFPRRIPELGRIAAQAAKQVIYQKVKEAERDKIYNEYIDRVGELVNGVVKRVERGDLVVDMGTTEAAVPRREQIRAEHYNPGDRVRAIIVDVERSGKGPQVVLSRTDPRLVLKLFEMEVPEIYDGTVRIVAVARDAGERSKIAVQSRDRDVDPVGACVGMKGNRVQSVIRELRGEKIDIVQYHEDAMAFVREALKPATANRVGSRDEVRRVVEVIVADEQLSLAIGKRGQNVRLAGRLVGWRIDVKSESEKRAEVDAEHEARARALHLFSRLGLEDKVAEALIDAGFRDLEQILSADLEDLTRVPGISEELALDIHDKAENLIDIVREEDLRARRMREELAAGAAASDAAVAEVANLLLGGSGRDQSGISFEDALASALEEANHDKDSEPGQSDQPELPDSDRDR